MPLKDLLFCIRQLRNNNYSITHIAAILDMHKDFVIAATRGIFD